MQFKTNLTCNLPVGIGTNFYELTRRNRFLSFDDVCIIPQYSEVSSRKDVDTSVQLGKFKLDIPIISANMETVTESEMCIAMHKAGGIGALHRFMSIDENKQQYKEVIAEDCDCFVSIGVGEDEKERFRALFNIGARHFIIDIAHGHSKQMFEMIDYIRFRFKEIPYIMAGNVATPRAIIDLLRWGANAVKIGIGPGAVCLTKDVTGVTVPQFSAIYDSLDYLEENSLELLKEDIELVRKGFFVADGGVKALGDVAKALGAGAGAVMCGRLLAPAEETPGPRVEGRKVYRGMASKDAMLKIRDENELPTPEGMSSILTDKAVPVKEILTNIKGALQSAFSYSNAHNLDEFQINVQFGLK